MINRDIFEDLFVLELANNHLGILERGLQIVREFGTVARYANVRTAIKLQLRDVDTFIHKDFLNSEARYIKKTIATKLSFDELALLIEAIRASGCIRMATPFDEKSVDTCVELGIDIIKVASSDIADWVLLEKIAKARKPVIVSTGGSTRKDTDDVVAFFDNRNIPLAINHCVSLYPCDDSNLQLNQIDYLINRYPHHVIGLSTHEHTDWSSSMLIAYAKGARTFERHIDIKDNNPLSPYCSTPEQIKEWFDAYRKARSMCGAPGTDKIQPTQSELDYLNTLVRGVYAKRHLPVGHTLAKNDYYLAVPLQAGQASCRELFDEQVICRVIEADEAIMVSSVSVVAGIDKIRNAPIRKYPHV